MGEHHLTPSGKRLKLTLEARGIPLTQRLTRALLEELSVAVDISPRYVSQIMADLRRFAGCPRNTGAGKWQQKLKEAGTPRREGG
jgi:hypothetical protein